MASRKKKPTGGENVAEKKQHSPAEEKPKTGAKKRTSKQKPKGPTALVPVDPSHVPTPKEQEPLPVPVAGPGPVRSSSGVPISFPDQERHNLFTRIVFLLTLAVVVAVSVLIFFLRPSAYTEQTDSVLFLYRPEQNVTVVAVNGTVRGEITGAISYETLDGTGRVYAVIAEGKLYTVKGRHITEVASAVTDCVLSSNGQYLAWRTEAQELFYQTVGKPESRYRISGSCTDDRYCLSPNGKELVYTYKGGDDVLRLDVYSGSGSKPYLSQNESLFPVAVADRCRYLYYTDANGALYVLSAEDNQRRKCGDAPDLDSLIFNRSCSELLFYNKTDDKMQTRIFRKGQNMILPDIASTDTLRLLPNRRVAIRERRVGQQYLMETFFDNYYVYYAESTVKLVLMERKDDQGRITDVSFVDSAETVTVTDKSVFFLRTAAGDATHTNLYRCKTGKTEVLDLQWDVQDFCTNVDGSRILYVDVHGALYSLRMGAVPEILYDSIVVEAGVRVSADDAFYFYREPGKLCVSDNGEAPREVRDGVLWAELEAHTLFYAVDATEDGRYTVYANDRNRRKDTQLATAVGRVD